jgi:PAS domain S-box-containing protein
VLCIFLVFSSALLAHAAEAPRPKRVLIISTGSRLSPGFALMDQGVLKGLAKIPSEQIELYAENIDILRFPGDRFERIFKEYLATKYAARPPDLIILVFVGSLEISANLLNQLFPAIPIVVAGATEEKVSADQFRSPLSGLAFRANPRATLELIFRLQPETRRVVVVGGTAEVDRDVMSRVKQTARSFTGQAEFEFWDNRSMGELQQAVAALPPQTVILFSRMFRDGAGRAVISTQVGQSIARWANVPVYVMTDTALGTGAVGGSVASINAIGERAGEMARLILTGTRPESLPLESDSGRVPMFDWRALRRWGISERRLPPDSVIRFRPESFWEQYRGYVLAALFVIGLQSVIIIDLLVERRRRRRTQKELQESQETVELATSAGEVGLWWRELSKGELWGNPPLRALFGFRPDDVLRSDDMLERIHPDDRAGLIDSLEHTQTGGLPFQGEFRIVRPDGTERWALAKGRTVEHPGRADHRRMGVILDITERKHAEEALKKERSFLRQVIDIDPNFIFAKDREGRFTMANRAVADAYGTSVEDLIGKTDADFNANRDEVEQFRRTDLEVIETLRERFIPEERITDAQGNVRWLQTVKRPIVESAGSATQLLGTSSDITRRKQTELELQEQRAELAHVARLSVMGELAASLAHELNQPLTAILSNAQAALRFLRSQSGNIEEVHEILHDIVKDDTRAGEVIRRMRALVKKEELEFASLDFEALLRDVVTLVHSDTILHNVRISLEVENTLPPVQGDRVQLQQVVLNILLNAFEAMEKCPVREREVRLRAELESWNSIEVTITDHGIGLTGDKLDKIFQPFYTTKREGLGMGLSICRSIIEAHGGRLWAENNRDGGATFYFTLPVCTTDHEQPSNHNL